MHKHLSDSRKRIIFLIGCILIPLLLLSALFYIGFSERNLSGLLNESAYFPFVHVSSFVMLAWLVFLLSVCSSAHCTRKHAFRKLGILILLISASLIIGYSFESSFIATLHIALAYAGLVYMNVLFYEWCREHTDIVRIYICLTLTAFLFSAGSGYVSGISEVLYGAGCSVLLTVCALRDMSA